jgi:hypothetical protein
MVAHIVLDRIALLLRLLWLCNHIMYIKLAQRPNALKKDIQSILSVLYTFLPLHLYNLHPAQQYVPTV